MTQHAPVEATAALPSAAIERPKRLPAEARRRQIILAAIRLFAQRGFRGTTTKEIAAAAGVNEALIFRYYATKQELYSAILEFKTHQSEASAWITELEVFGKRRDDQGLFAAVARKILEHYGHDREFLHLMLYSALEGHELARMFGEQQVLPIKQFLRDYVITRQREGVFRRWNPDVVVYAFIGMPSHHALVKELLCWEAKAFGDRDAVSCFTRIFLEGLHRGVTPRPRGAPSRRKKD